MRGVCRYVRAAGYSSMDKADYFRHANEALLIIQIEGQAAIDNLDEILAVEGIDIVFVGPYDLSQSLGVPGEVEHPLLVDKMKKRRSLRPRCGPGRACVICRTRLTSESSTMPARLY